MFVNAWRRRAGNRFDDALTVAALAIAVVMALPIGGGNAGTLAQLVLTLVAWLPLAARLRWPVPVAAVAMAVDAAHVAVAAHHHSSTSFVPVATMLALYTVAARRGSRAAWVCAAVVALTQLSVGAASGLRASGYLLYINWALVGAALGRLMAARRASVAAAEQRAVAAEATKAAEVARQVAAERIRIAHELHDVLAHHLAVVNAQAGVAEYLLGANPGAARQALAGIAENSRAALEELRATLRVLRTDPAEAGAELVDSRRPTPGAAQLPALVERYRDAGMSVVAEVVGAPRPLAAPADLALYRIAQEALTNAAKHAVGSAVSVDLRWADAAVRLTVANSAPAHGPASGSAAAVGTGNGLIGMRERAEAADGTLRAVPTPEGGFRVVAELPAPPADPAGVRSAHREPMRARPEPKENR
ncbi:MAG: histidine kinase [Actinomycetia bacterium]|nr:histidine kinase [Actinomycetes bacterium]